MKTKMHFISFGYVRTSSGRWGRAIVGQRWALYLDGRDRWIGWYHSELTEYFCPLPCVVIRWMRTRRIS